MDYYVKNDSVVQGTYVPYKIPRFMMFLFPLCGFGLPVVISYTDSFGKISCSKECKMSFFQNFSAYNPPPPQTLYRLLKALC